MELKLKVCEHYCSCKEFEINGVKASSIDFGNQEDISPSNDGGCGDMEFTMKEPEERILTKYGITEEEYVEIAKDLEKKLSFGCCGECI
jgi:hypothetical protein